MPSQRKILKNLLEQRIEHTKRVLDMLSQENIVSREVATLNQRKKLGTMRNLIEDEAQVRNVFCPGLTIATAVTKLGIAACNEFSQRFILEYCLSSKKAEANFIVLVSKDDPGNNHAIVLLGKAQAPKELFENSASAEVVPGISLTISEFLSRQTKDSVIVDPLFNAYGDGAVANLATYCAKDGITHVVSIVEFVSPSLLEKAEMIKENATKIAAEVNLNLSLGLMNGLLNKTVFNELPLEEWKFHPQNQYFYVRGTEAAVREAEGILKDFFTRGELGEIQIVKNPKTQQHALVINKKALQLDYARLLDITFSRPGVVEALNMHRLFTTERLSLPETATSAKGEAETLTTRNKFS